MSDRTTTSAVVPGVPLLELPEMDELDGEILALMKEINPQTMYRLGFQDLKERIFIPSKKNIEKVSRRVEELRVRCGDNEKGRLARKFLDSIDAVNSFGEPHPDVGLVSEVFATHLIKEGIEPETFKTLAEQLISALNASLEKFEGINFTAPVKVLIQYQVIGAFEILDVVEYGTKDRGLLDKLSELRERVQAFSKRFSVDRFSDGEFEEVVGILKRQGADLDRSAFYETALKKGFDYEESPEELEEKALSWIREDLPKFKKATKTLSEEFRCDNSPGAVDTKLRSKPSFRPEQALAAVLKIRPVIQDLVAESIVGMNPRYDAIVLETPSYLAPILPTAAVQEFDLFTDKPSQRFYITTDPKRAPPTNFADLLNLLVHEEYGHCLHASNTAAHYAAEPSLVEMLPSLHGGTTSEGLAFQRELEFLDMLHALAEKLRETNNLSDAEREFVALTKQYGGFDQVLREMEFSTYKQRLIRFLRVVGDVRINSGKQSLLDFLKWAEEETGLSQRTVYFQLFPAHEGIFPGYATCYAVVGQQIREIQKPIAHDPTLLVKFNAYACSMGFPARSIFEERLRKYASVLLATALAPVAHEPMKKEIVEAQPPTPRIKTSRKLVIPRASSLRKAPTRKSRTVHGRSKKKVAQCTRQTVSKSATKPKRSRVHQTGSSKRVSPHSRKSRSNRNP